MKPQDPMTQNPIDPQGQAPTDPTQAAKDLEDLTKNPVPTLAEEVATFEASNVQATSPKPQIPINTQAPMTQVSSTTGGKEMEPQQVQSSKGAEGQSSEVEEIPEEMEIKEEEKEIESYIQKVEKAPELKKPLTDDYTQQVLLASASPTGNVVLPMSREEIKSGLHHKVWEGVRWLAEWCVRQIKVVHGRIKYKS